MPAQYATPTFQGTTATTLKTAVLLTSIAGLRPRLYEFSLGADGAPNAIPLANPALSAYTCSDVRY